MRIVCFGDSNTYGFDPRGYLDDRYENCWPELLALHTGWEVTNAGMNGRTIPRHVPDWILNAYQSTDCFLVMLGTNDLLQGASALDTARRMESFLTQIIPHCGDLLLVAPPTMQRGAWVSTADLVTESIRLMEEYRALAQKLNIAFADTRDWNIALAFDGVHFTQEGHHTFAAQMEKQIQKHLPFL